MLRRIFFAGAFAPSLAIFLLGSVTAEALTKDQCAELTTSTPKAVLSLGELEKSVGTINWGELLPHLSGQIRTNAQLAKQAQEDFVRALRRYRITLEDFSYSAQQCARIEPTPEALAQRAKKEAAQLALAKQFPGECGGAAEVAESSDGKIYGRCSSGETFLVEGGVAMRCSALAKLGIRSLCP